MDGPHLLLDPKKIRADALDGKLSVLDLVEIIERQHKASQRLATRLQGQIRILEQRLAQYEPNKTADPTAKPTAANQPDQPDPNQPGVPDCTDYSLDSEEKRRGHRKKSKKSPGRTPTIVKVAQAEVFENIYPEGVDPSECRLARERAVWRILDNKARLVAYRIYMGPDGKEPRIPGVLPYSEYGIEVSVTLAFLIYQIGISFEKACVVMGFFTQLDLDKSQADSLLNQLAKHWETDFACLCSLIAHAAVVYMDETGWKVNNQSCSLWMFATETLRVFLFGCHKDQATLDAMLPPDVFEGIGVSDNAAVYSKFQQAQKCWAHLLRKAIRLALLYPNNERYQKFLDELLSIYYDAKRAAKDGRLGDFGRAKRENELSERVGKLLDSHDTTKTETMLPHENDFVNLVLELKGLSEVKELFTFVLHPEVEATNNLSERTIRGSVQDRKAGRTNKSGAGAHRRSVIVSILESLKVSLPAFGFSSVVSEVVRWMKEGISTFAKQWEAIQQKLGGETASASGAKK